MQNFHCDGDVDLLCCGCIHLHWRHDRTNLVLQLLSILQASHILKANHLGHFKMMVRTLNTRWVFANCFKIVGEKANRK